MTGGFGLSSFGSRYSGVTGISELMVDLSSGPSSPGPLIMLGGGNPAIIPEVSALWDRGLRRLLDDGAGMARLLGAYDSQLGRESFREAIASSLAERYGWDITERNVAVVNGSQIAFFYLLNMFSGVFPDGRRRRILLPVVPEYIGYADQCLDPAAFAGRKPTIQLTGERTFKYGVDFDAISMDAEGDGIGAICVSRPTNPTGNVLTEDEILTLAAMAGSRGIPLLLDNAYGLPFPGIIFRDAEPVWNESIILSMSLSKIGLPALRTGIIVAAEGIVDALSATNAIASLATGSLGPAIAEPLVRSGELFDISRTVVRPYYEARSKRTIEILEAELKGIPWAVHESEGAIFLWLWFKDMPVPSRELYRRLKARNVIVVPGEYFFFGLDGDWPHSRECVRLNYSAPENIVESGIRILGEELRLVYGNRR
jgi:valine--pyruvate aminotransferase